MESGKLTPAIVDVELILEALGSDDPAASQILELVRTANTEWQDHWSSRRRGLDKKQNELARIETVTHWLIKPAKLVRGTWEEPKEAAEWLGQRLAEYAPRFACESDRDSTRLALLVYSAAERLGWGGDVSHGFYLERPAFLSAALVTCSPNRAAPDLACPTVRI